MIPPSPDMRLLLQSTSRARGGGLRGETESVLTKDILCRPRHRRRFPSPTPRTLGFSEPRGPMERVATGGPAVMVPVVATGVLAVVNVTTEPHEFNEGSWVGAKDPVEQGESTVGQAGYARLGVAGPALSVGHGRLAVREVLVPVVLVPGDEVAHAPPREAFEGPVHTLTVHSFRGPEARLPSRRIPPCFSVD